MPGCGKRGVSLFSLPACECNQLVLVANLVLTEGTTLGSGGYGPPRQSVRGGGYRGLGALAFLTPTNSVFICKFKKSLP